MRLLDTREQKSPRFLLDAFPDIVQTQLEVGDYFTGDVKSDAHLVEIKIGKDFGIHTEQLERFQDECNRMACYRQQNPHVQLHAVWATGDYQMNLHSLRLWFDLCQKYHIWGHVFNDNYEPQLIEFLKALDQPSQYKEFEPFIKKSHDEPTILAKMLRQFPKISSEMAIRLANAIAVPIKDWFWWENGLNGDECIIQNEIISTIGRKKHGDPKKLATDLIRWLETGEIA